MVLCFHLIGNQEHPVAKTADDFMMSCGVIILKLKLCKLRYTAILDSGASSSFIRKSNLPPGTERLIIAPSPVSVKYGKGKALSLEGKIRLHVTLGSEHELVTFYVAQWLSTSIIIGCDVYEKTLQQSAHAHILLNQKMERRYQSYWNHLYVLRIPCRYPKTNNL